MCPSTFFVFKLPIDKQWFCSFSWRWNCSPICIMNRKGWWKLILFISLKMARNWKYLLRFCHLCLRMEVPNPAHSLSFFSLPKHCGRALLPVNVLLHSCRLHLPIVNFSPYSPRLLKTFQLKLKPRISSFFNSSYLTDSCIVFTLQIGVYTIFLI